MKRINLLLRFLNKKGALIFGIIIGLLVAFVTAGVIVHAEESTEEKTTYILASGTKVEGGSYNVDVQFELIYNDIGNPLERFCAYRSGGPYPYPYDDKKMVSTYQIVSDLSYAVTGGNSGAGYDYVYRSQIWNSETLAWKEEAGMQAAFQIQYFLNGNIAVYEFDSLEKCVAYLKGELDASNALNYDEIQSGGVTNTFDKTIPVPVSAYVSAITESNVSSIFKYDETELSDFYSEHNVELCYDYSCEYLYQYLTKAQIDSFSKDGSNVLFRGAMDYDTETYNDQKLLKTHGTCGEFYEVAKAGGNNTSALNYLFTADTGSYTDSGKVCLENALSSVPPNYYDLYSQDLSFFSMEYHMQFVGVQIKIDTYYYDDSGTKICSDSIYIRRFLFNTLNDAFETTYTRITHDDEGNDVFHSSYEQDANGNMTSGAGTLDTENVLEHVKNGFGLAGKDGYLELLRRTFLGVPGYIWGIIATALGVNLIVLAFKVLRGI